jgi:hypothetical protein
MSHLMLCRKQTINMRNIRRSQMHDLGDGSPEQGGNCSSGDLLRHQLLEDMRVVRTGTRNQYHDFGI